MLRWASENLLQLKPEEIGEHYGRYRLHVPEAERAMAKSLERYGQSSPVVVCRRDDGYELIDGFKRLAAARHLTQVNHLSARLMEADERTVKAAGFNPRIFRLTPSPFKAASHRPADSMFRGDLRSGWVCESRTSLFRQARLPSQGFHARVTTEKTQFGA